MTSVYVPIRLSRQRVKIPVVRICDLPLPPPPEPTPIDSGPVGTQMILLESKPEVKDAPIIPEAGKPEANNELQTDPAHPPAVQEVMADVLKVKPPKKNPKK